MKKSGHLRGQGAAGVGVDSQLTKSGGTQEAAVGLAFENIGGFDEEGAAGIEEDGGIRSGILFDAGGIGMLEENFSRGLELQNILGAIGETEIEGLENVGRVGVRFAKPGTAGVIGAQNGEDVFAGSLDGQAARTHV